MYLPFVYPNAIASAVASEIISSKCLPSTVSASRELPVPSSAVVKILFELYQGALLKTNLSPVAAYVRVAAAPLIVIPAPSAAAAFDALSARTRLRSLRETVVLLIVVWTPCTCRLPLMIRVPASLSIGAGSI
jgi:hypothetical protein